MASGREVQVMTWTCDQYLKCVCVRVCVCVCVCVCVVGEYCRIFLESDAISGWPVSEPSSVLRRSAGDPRVACRCADHPSIGIGLRIQSKYS